MNSNSPVLYSKCDIVELFNGIPHGIAMLDTNLCITAMNRSLEAITGFAADQVIGIYGDYVLRTSLSTNDHICRQILEEGGTVSREGDIINRSRLRIPINCTMTRIDREGVPFGVLIVIEDISAFNAAKTDNSGNDVQTKIIGHSQQMESIYEMMSVLAQTDASVLITGETGTGKDKIAEQLHQSSKRNRRPFIKVNCGALPEALLESELFGHTKGAFTGAVNDNLGKFKLADKGTIFLTEIGDLSPPLQVKLLSVLDDQEFFPVGSNKKIKVDVRITAATHRSLRKEVKLGRFREDLYYRLNVLHLHVPPLRERDGDVHLLLDHFLRQFSEALNRTIHGFSQKALDILLQYKFPGNVRELRNIVEYAANVCRSKQISVDDLPEYMFLATETKKPVVSIINEFEDAIELTGSQSSLKSSWAEIEKENILNTLQKTGGNRAEAASLLGWGRTTLWRKIKKYGIT